MFLFANRVFADTVSKHEVVLEEGEFLLKKKPNSTWRHRAVYTRGQGGRRRRAKGCLGAPEARREDWSRLSLMALGRNPACDTSNLGFHPPVLETIHFYCLSQLVCDILPPKSREMCKPLIRVVIRKEITALGRLLYVAIQCTKTCTLFSLYFFFLSLIKRWQGWLTVP